MALELKPASTWRAVRSWRKRSANTSLDMPCADRAFWFTLPSGLRRNANSGSVLKMRCKRSLLV